MIALGAQELTTFGGYHTQLFGYKDNRYVDSDKGDYLKALAWYSGTEFVQKGFKTDDPRSQRVVLGGGVLLYVQNGFDQKTLYEVRNGPGGPVLLSEERVPASTGDRSSKFQLNLSAFGGYQDEWWGAEGGLSVFIKGEEERVRQMKDAVNQPKEVAGRGWVFGDGSLVLPNLKLRLGTEVLPHFVLSLFRGHYDPGYGALQARVVLPLNPGFTLQVGGSMFQTSSIFLEPMVNVGDYSVSVRAGTILNYNDAAFTRVGIFEGAFVSGSVGIRW